MLEILLEADVWTAQVKDFRSTAEDPQVKHLGLMQSFQHPVAGKVEVVGPAITMSETQPTIECPAPLVGEHGREILSEFGISDEEISKLEESDEITIAGK